MLVQMVKLNILLLPGAEAAATGAEAAAVREAF